LLNELRQRTDELTESLEQQTATSDILQVVAKSSGLLEPVFKTILEKSVILCAAKFATFYLSEEDGFRAAALHNAPLALAEMLNQTLVRPGPHVPLGRVAATKKLAHIADMTNDPCYIEDDPLAVMGAERCQAVETVGTKMPGDRSVGKSRHGVAAAHQKRPESHPKTRCSVLFRQHDADDVLGD
jgi:hypothetical protein